MLLSNRPMPLSSMSNLDDNSARSHQTTSSAPLVPPTVLPKYFNVPFAIQHGYFRCVRYLLELSSDPNERDDQLRTPLILCSYVENDRWSLSLAQNLLEKSAKIALEDHARRNAMHHACALQRIHLVQLYLSCLDFKLGAKDCEGNTCLHYVAITGNCEIAELLMKSAEKMDIRLDQYVNREGCSAAVLALKYGHIECANQITHRDWDEFFVIPRPLSIYETPPTTTDNTTLITTTTTTNASSVKKKKKNQNISPPSSTTKSDMPRSNISFGLLKIIFNESDSSYSTRLAGLCNKDKPPPHRRRRTGHQKSQTTTDPAGPTSTHYCSTEAIVNELQTSKIEEEEIAEHSNDSKDILHTDRSSPRVQLLIQQHFTSKAHPSTDDFRLSNEQVKSKTSIPTIYRQASGSTLNQIEPSGSLVYDSSDTKTNYRRPRTAIVTRNQTSVNAVGAPSRLSSAHTRTPSTEKRSKKKSSVIHRPSSASLPPKQPKQYHSNLASETSTYSQTLFAGRPLSALLQCHTRHPLPVQRTADTTCSIREAKGATSRYNQPEKLFGLKPEELFATTEHQPKINPSRKTNDNTRSKRHRAQEHRPCQQDIDKLIDLFNIHHSSNYRSGAVPPPIIVQAETIPDLTPAGRPRRMSGSKHPLGASKPHVNIKLSTLASLHIPRRNSISQRAAFKLINA